MEEWWQSVEEFCVGIGEAQDRKEQALVQIGVNRRQIAKKKTVSFIARLICYYPTPGEGAGQF
jgi:hypothetical protein